MYNVKRNGDFRGSVDIYVTSNEEWLEESDQPLITALYQIADQLDSAPKITATLVTEFRLLMSDLHKRKPIPRAQLKQEVEELEDEFDKLIKEF